MKIAVAGCAHGQLEVMYSTIKDLEGKENIKIDLLICCGDFQATRNEADLRCMAVPVKYYDMGSFYKYYSQEEIAPVLTIFIGGNHEASNYLQELEYGGWVAPNIYYMGYAGVIDVGGIRIGGISGIYKGHDYMKGHFEKSPYNHDTKRSVYHVRNYEVFQLKQLKEPLDIMISHDWPRGVYKYGCIEDLLKKKPFFRKDINDNKLGSKPCEELLFHLKPKYWFSAHLHVKFSAVVPQTVEHNQFTKFLALDKCLPGRDFLQVIDIPHNKKEIYLSYDLEWLTVLHSTNYLISTEQHIQYMPRSKCEGRWIFTPNEEEKRFVFNKLNFSLKIPLNFVQTAPVYQQLNDSFSTPPSKDPIVQPCAKLNPQTSFLCDMLGIVNRMSSLMSDDEKMLNLSSSSVSFGQDITHTFLDTTIENNSSVSNNESYLGNNNSDSPTENCNITHDDTNSTFVDSCLNESDIFNDISSDINVCHKKTTVSFDDRSNTSLESVINNTNSSFNDLLSDQDNVSISEGPLNRTKTPLLLPSPKFHSDNSDKSSSPKMHADTDDDITTTSSPSTYLDAKDLLNECCNNDKTEENVLPKKFQRRNRAIYDCSNDQ